MGTLVRVLDMAPDRLCRVDNDPPDFEYLGDSGLIAIEVVGATDETLTAAARHEHDKVLVPLQDMVAALGVSGAVYVHVDMTVPNIVTHPKLRDGTLEPLAQFIAASWRTGALTSEDRVPRTGSDTTDGVDWISYSPTNEPECVVSVIRGHQSYGSLHREHVDRACARKQNGHVAERIRANGRYTESWLLVVTGSSYGQIVHLPFVDTHVVTSSFDRVFVVDVSRGAAHELGIACPAP